jgi:peptide/nickel transport system substrate-binding protein
MTVLSLALALMLAVSIFAVSSASAQAQAQAEQQPRKGPRVDQIKFIHYENEGTALEDVRAGRLDAYYFKIPLEVAGDAKDDPRVKIYERIAGSNSLLLNPAPSADKDTLNPFQFREVRFAMNYLIDRDMAVNELQKGYGSPLVDPFGIYSPEYLNIIDTVESFGFRHNPQLADKIISDALTEAGASRDSAGRWMFAGKQVTIKILIRSDDEPRRLIGEDVASRLEKIGFKVDKEYGDLNKANTVVYGSDPKELKWHIYTEGFAGTSVFVKYNPVIPAQMYAPWYGRMPGYQNPAFWQYQNSTLDTVTQRILFANFMSEPERNDLVRQAVRMGIQESVRIFVNQKTDPFIASPSVTGLVNDFGAGITSKYSALNAQSPAKNSLDIGVKQIHQGAWNGVGGLQDTYSRDIYSTVVDSATFRHPYTGEIIPFRTTWIKITTAGPEGKKLVVPKSAVVWDPVAQKWAAAKEPGATSKVMFRALYSNWHHGIPMDRADMLYSYYFIFEWGTDTGKGDRTVDPEFTSAAAPNLPLLKGIKFTRTGFESYVDYWHYDKKEIADFASVWPGEPWEITAATERLVSDGKIAYSRGEATVKKVEWLDMIVPEHAALVKQELQRMKDESYVPPALKGIVSAQDAQKRYDASIKWIEEHGNAVIGNGPFYLDSYNIPGRTITVKAFRDPSYPFKEGQFASFETAKLARIVKADIPRTAKAGNEINATVMLQVDGKPSNDAQVSYFVSDKSGSVVVKGAVAPAQGKDEGTFEIDIPASETAKMSAGPNQIKVFASSNQAFKPHIVTATIIIVGGSGGGA